MTFMKEKTITLKKGSRSEEINQEIRSLSAEYESLRDKEEMIWRQCAKAHWIREH